MIRKFDDLIAVCNNRVRPAPHEYPIHDYPWGIQEVGSVDELIEQFQFGNFSVRTGFVLGDLAFIEQVSGGNEWLALKLDDGEWKSFDSISFYHMLKQSGEDACRDFIEHLRETPWHDLKYSSEPEDITLSNEYQKIKDQLDHVILYDDSTMEMVPSRANRDLESPSEPEGPTMQM